MYVYTYFRCCVMAGKHYIFRCHLFHFALIFIDCSHSGNIFLFFFQSFLLSYIHNQSGLWTFWMKSSLKQQKLIMQSNGDSIMGFGSVCFGCMSGFISQDNHKCEYIVTSNLRLYGSWALSLCHVFLIQVHQSFFPKRLREREYVCCWHFIYSM